MDTNLTYHMTKISSKEGKEKANNIKAHKIFLEIKMNVKRHKTKQIITQMKEMTLLSILFKDKIQIMSNQ